MKKIADWHAMPREKAFYNKSELFLHKKLWDALNCDEAGRPKDHSFVDWCRRITRHCNETTAANALTPAMRCITLRTRLAQRKQENQQMTYPHQKKFQKERRYRRHASETRPGQKRDFAAFRNDDRKLVHDTSAAEQELFEDLRKLCERKAKGRI